jgi:epsilon-lactone hydrolase
MTYKNPDIQKFRDIFQPLLAEFRQKSIAEQRAQFDAEMESVPLADGCTAERLDLSGVPAEKVVHLGGGYVFGSLKSHRHLVSRLAVAADVTGYQLGYRLSPEHPYPAALEDAEKAYRQLLASGIAPEHLIVGGESAGGNLAASLLLKAKAEGLPQPAGLYLLSPWLDMSTTGVSYGTVGSRDLILSREVVDTYAATFLNGQPDDPFTSPVRADLGGFPAVLIQVGTEEVLLADSLSFASRASLAGLEISMQVWPEMPHSWPMFHPIIRAGLSAIDEAGQWMRQRLLIASRRPKCEDRLD